MNLADYCLYRWSKRRDLNKEQQYGEMITMRAVIKVEEDLTLDKAMLLHCMNGDVEELKEVLAAGANQHHIDTSGSNAITYAAGYASIECLAILLENATKEDLEVVNIFGHSPLTIASRYENVGIPMNDLEHTCVGMVKAKLEKLEMEREIGMSQVEAPRRRMRM